MQKGILIAYWPNGDWKYLDKLEPEGIPTNEAVAYSYIPYNWNKLQISEKVDVLNLLWR